MAQLWASFCGDGGEVWSFWLQGQWDPEQVEGAALERGRYGASGDLRDMASSVRGRGEPEPVLVDGG